MAETYSHLLAKAFADIGITDAFVVTGGAIAPFTSALAEQGRISMHFMLTEQSAGVAAEAYGFYDGRPCLLVVTSGPGVTNCLTAIAAAYTNSSPVIVVSGQARVEDVRFAERGIRQAGNQHLRTREMVSTITKRFHEPTEQIDCTSLVNDLMTYSTSHRRGPTWLSLPIDLQRQISLSDIVPLKNYKHEDFQEIEECNFNEFVSLFRGSRRPAMLLGNGARDAIDYLKDFANRFKIPILTTWPGLDLIEASEKMYVGRPGSLPSSRLPNYVTYHSDFLIIVGARLDLAQVGYNTDKFAENSAIWRVDVDLQELQRFPRPNWNNIQMTSFEFARKLNSATLSPRSSYNDWWKQIEEWRKADKTPILYDQEIADGVSTYSAVQFLSEKLSPRVAVTGSSGTCIEMLLQTWTTSPGQRIINSCGLGSMGFALPAAIGVSYKISNDEVVCIESDGSLVMSLQELSTVANHHRNLKIVVLDSGGYKSILLSQRRTGQYLHGFDSTTGLRLPEISEIAKAHGIRHKLVNQLQRLDEELIQFLRQDGPCILQIKVSATEAPLPRLIPVSQADGSLRAPTLIELSPSE